MIARSMPWLIGVSLVLALAVRPAAAQVQPVPPELLVYPNLVVVNGKVLTVDSQFSIAEAVAMRDGRILAVGTSNDMRRLVGPTTRVVDAGGRSVVPGFIDSDGDNAFAGGDLYKDTMVNGKIGTRVRDDSVPAMLKQVSALVAQAAPGSPVFVRMADEWIAQLSKLTAKDLDAIAPNNPLSLALSSSEGVVNTIMLNRAFAAGLPRDHIGVVKDAAGRPTGQLFGAAIGMVGWNLRDWPELSDAIFDDQLKINSRFLRGGVTTVTGHASGYTVTIMSQLYHQGRLDLRIRPDLDFARQNPLAVQFLRRTPNLVDFELGDGMVRVVGAAVGPVDGASDDGGILTHRTEGEHSGRRGRVAHRHQQVDRVVVHGPPVGRPFTGRTSADRSGHAAPDAQAWLEHRRQPQHGQPGRRDCAADVVGRREAAGHQGQDDARPQRARSQPDLG